MRGLFRNRTFRWLLAGRVITNVGDSIYFVGAMWLVYSLTNDPVYTGVAGFVTMFRRRFSSSQARWSISGRFGEFSSARNLSKLPSSH